MGGSVFRSDEEGIRNHLESGGRFALDGVRVQYPNTLILSVHERTRDGMVPSSGKILVVDSDGYVVEVSANVPENCGVYVRGLNCTAYNLGRRVTAPEAQLEAMKVLLEAIRTLNAGSYLSEVNVEDPLNLWMVSRTGIKVELGDSTNMNDKIMWACSAIADLESRGQTKGTLDVTSGAMADFSAP
jgi:cell division septal protein FtsQ